VGYIEGRFIDLLPQVQAVAARVCTPLTDEHPGQLAWSSIYEGREAPAIVLDGEAYGFLETPDFLEVGGDVSRAAEVLEWARARSAAFAVRSIDGPLAGRLAELGGEVVPDATWDIQQTIDLSAVTVPDIPGYRFRHVEREEVAARAECHRAAWSDSRPSRMTEQMYRWLMDAPYYDTALDWVAVSESDGEMAASCITWVSGDVALVEPVGCAPAHRRRGLGGGVTLAALAAARDQGAKVGIVRPPGHDGYPAPVLVYRSIGFVDRLRNREFRFAAG
jgi:GNAT superfamily N-acetyltransferase